MRSSRQALICWIAIQACVCGVQTSLEGISEQLRIPGSKALGPISSAVRKSKSVLNNDKAKIIADFAPQNKVRVLADSSLPLGHEWRLNATFAICGLHEMM